jgi:hypothetical protein
MNRNLRDFDDVLTYIGGWGKYNLINNIKDVRYNTLTHRYQKILVFFSMCNAMIMAYCAYAPILFLYFPDHHCAPNPELIGIMSEANLFNLSIPLNDSGDRDKCNMYELTLDDVRFCWYYLTVIIISQVVKLSGHKC